MYLITFKVGEPAQPIPLDYLGPNGLDVNWGEQEGEMAGEKKYIFLFCLHRVSHIPILCFDSYRFVHLFTCV